MQRPEELIPERFDPSSDISKTPKGTKRHPMSFALGHLWRQKNLFEENIC